jgi:ABC-type uncharacterized transport system permease subunit
MILLHVMVVALYGLTAYALWPATAGHGASGPPADRVPAGVAAWILPMALLLHAWIGWHDVATPEGLDLSFVNAVSVVAGLVAAVAWVSGLLATLPAVGTVVLPIAAVASLLPALIVNVHRFNYTGDTIAAVHVAIALGAYAMFLVAALQALLLMGLEKRLRRRMLEPEAAAVPLLTLERFLFRLIAVGFLLLTLTLVSGMLFTEQLFGKPLVFNHKSVFSVLGWLTFGALLIGRWRYGWRGRVALRWIIAGTVFLFLAYLGSKFVLEVLLGR